MVRWFIFALFLGFPPLTSAAALAASECINLREVFGEYETVEVSRYRGGLTSYKEAIEHIEEKVVIYGSTFLLWDEINYNAPHYSVACHPIPLEEGEVPMPWERRGDFYGIGIDRDVVNVLTITPVKEEGPRYQFEVVDNELWFFFDGWFYRMTRQSSQ